MKPPLSNPQVKNSSFHTVTCEEMVCKVMCAKYVLQTKQLFGAMMIFFRMHVCSFVNGGRALGALIGAAIHEHPR